MNAWAEKSMRLSNLSILQKCVFFYWQSIDKLIVAKCGKVLISLSRMKVCSMAIIIGRITSLET